MTGARRSARSAPTASVPCRPSANGPPCGRSRAAGRSRHGRHRGENIRTRLLDGIPAPGRLVPGAAALLAIALSPGAGAQGVPSEREANTRLLIDLAAGPPPATISASGLYSDIEALTPSPGLIPYSVNSPLWSDGAHKVRYLALPGLSRIEFSRDGPWRFPANTVLVKSFYLDMVRGDPSSRRIVETRLLIKAGDSDRWEGFSYRWNEAGTDAELLIPGGATRYEIADPAAPGGRAHVDYLFPASEDCGRCHTPQVGQVLGVRTAQLNGLHDYGGASAHQLETWSRLGLFSGEIGGGFEEFPRWEDPADEAAPLAARARSYLAANCANCHRPGGLRRTEIDLRYATALEAAGIVNAPPNLGVDGFDRRILLPGDGGNSVLVLRMLALDDRRMPPLASGLVDEEGVRLISRWIDALGEPTAVSGPPPAPGTPSLLSGHPNPFNASAAITWSLAREGPVDLAVHDVSGRRVRTLVSSRLGAGDHQARWDGRDDGGAPAASGVYLVRMRSGADSRALKLTLLR